jgi:methanogenic corrinoid protein MtbC1
VFVFISHLSVPEGDRAYMRSTDRYRMAGPSVNVHATEAARVLMRDTEQLARAVTAQFFKESSELLRARNVPTRDLLRCLELWRNEVFVRYDRGEVDAINAILDAGIAMTPRENFLEALKRGDRQSAFRTVDAQLTAGDTLSDIYLRIVQPSMRDIGQLWQDNELTVAQEHVATAIAEASMSRLFERTFVWRDNRTPKLLAACAEDERHQIGLRMLCDLLELDGWETVYVGASVPIESLVQLVQKSSPDAVAISATIAPHIPRVRAAIASIRATDLERQPVIAVGGRAFHNDPTLASRIGADVTASDADEAVRMLDSLVRRGRAA